MTCNLCPNTCNVDRSKTTGACGESDKLKIAKYYLHPFEEPIVSGKNGSGTVFFCGCSLKCVFCQNYELSRSMRGKVVSCEELSDIFCELEKSGAHNINLVSPTHFAKSIIKALDIRRPNIPVIWNTHGYETNETIALIDPYVDVYLTDLKFFSPSRSQRYCGRADYFDVAFAAAKTMINSRPLLIEDGLIKRGVIIRHLILPQNLDETKSILSALRPVIGDAILSLMSQYTPFGDYAQYPELHRTITRREYEIALDHMNSFSFEHTFVQDFSSQSTEFIPDWDY